MGRLGFYCFLTAVVLLLLLSTVVYSDTFTDTFDDPNFTNSNWVTATDVQQSWSFPILNGSDLGYHVSTTSKEWPGAMTANNNASFYSAGLYAEILVKIDSHSTAYSSENIAGLAFGTFNTGNGYAAGLQLDFDESIEIDLSIVIIGKDSLMRKKVSIEFDTFYKLIFQIDSNKNMSASLYRLNGDLLGSVFAENVLSIDSGLVGIYGRHEVTFDDFNFSGNAVGDLPVSLTQTQVSQLYVSIFGRASEGEGNAYWQSQPDMATAAAAMLDTQAAKDYFGANLNTNQAFIEHIYLNTLNKTIADDYDGISYWVNMLNTGTTRGEAVAILVGVIKEYAPGAQYYNPDDNATVVAYNQFMNRVEISNYMADNVWDTPGDWQTSTSFSHGLVVTDDPATAYAAMVLVNGF
ncbi:MAG: DUF4214 domain-containing protein [Desulfotignum sp.]|nr:DUF4214 domain-containing protein [Desulfotignum sp.]